MIKGQKVQLFPTKEQEQLLIQSCGVARFVYNRCKRISEVAYRLTGKSPSQVTLSKYFTRLRHRPKYSWLKDVSADIAKQATKDYTKAKNASFSKFGNGFKVRYKSKFDFHLSIPILIEPPR